MHTHTPRTIEDGPTYHLPLGYSCRAKHASYGFTLILYFVYFKQAYSLSFQVQTDLIYSQCHFQSSKTADH